MQQLISQSVRVAKALIKMGIAVLGVSRNRMTDGRQMSADLMTAPGNQMHLQQCQSVSGFYRHIFCPDQLGIEVSLAFDMLTWLRISSFFR